MNRVAMQFHARTAGLPLQRTRASMFQATVASPHAGRRGFSDDSLHSSDIAFKPAKDGACDE